MTILGSKLVLAACGCCLVAAALAGAAGGGKGPFGEYCRYVEAGPPGPRGNKLVVFGPSGGIQIRRKGRKIRVSNIFAPPCTGGRPTVDNLDRIILRVTQRPPDSEPVRVDLRGGPFRPGATPEPSRDQIEILADGFALEVEGGKGADAMVARTLGGGHIGVDLDRSAHSQRRDYEIVVPRSPYALKLIGGRGRDRLDTRGITNMGDHRQRHVIRLYGKHGSDLILGGPRDEWRIEDGAGNDVVRTGGGDDEVVLGRGHDTVFGGRGRDSLYYAVYERFAGLDPTDVSDRVFGGPGADYLSDENRARDLLRCGPGIDEFEIEPQDRPGDDCERRVHP
jgi:hypothetical protein